MRRPPVSYLLACTSSGEADLPAAASAHDVSLQHPPHDRQRFISLQPGRRRPLAAVGLKLSEPHGPINDFHLVHRLAQESGPVAVANLSAEHRREYLPVYTVTATIAVAAAAVVLATLGVVTPGSSRVAEAR